MSPELSGAVTAVLHAFQRLYGDGAPQVQNVAAVRTAAAEQAESAGPAALGYTDARAMQTAVAESQTGRDNSVREAASKSVDSTVTGRNRLSGHIADFESRIKAISSVGDTRFSGPATLSAAQLALADATRQVNADIAAARQVAAQIMPPAVPQPMRRSNSLPPRRRRGRGRGRGASYVGDGRHARRGRIPHDGSAGSTAVDIAISLIGTPYVWGGSGPADGGYDCSSLVRHAIAEATGNEVMLPRTTYDQIHSGQRVDLWDARAGDLVFPADSFGYDGPEHVQLADGRGGVIEAPYPGAHVRWAPMPSNATVVRVLLPRE
ncbi:C40 family peptidase [Nocardia brasiliensis]|uniref:C40 family peptidase n=1 Tax=Nocardia brasiliensis TaxID=37326 RepID=UPI0024568636|nr:NlpC/P60 family protein [Nocardia brasiliensis]